MFLVKKKEICISIGRSLSNKKNLKNLEKFLHTTLIYKIQISNNHIIVNKSEGKHAW